MVDADQVRRVRMRPRPVLARWCATGCADRHRRVFHGHAGSFYGSEQGVALLFGERRRS